MRSYEIVLRRANGRFVKVLETWPSRYAAKKRVPYFEEKYDPTYEVTIEKKE